MRVVVAASGGNDALAGVNFCLGGGSEGRHRISRRRREYDLLFRLCSSPSKGKNMRIGYAQLFTLVVFTAAQMFLNTPAGAASLQYYKLAAAFRVGGDGGWDYVTLDPSGRRLYVTRSSHTMVVDVSTGRLVGDIPGMRLAHGVALVPEAGRGFISDGKDGSVIVFELKTGATLGKVTAAPDADSIIYDPASRRVLVFCGDAHQMVAIAPDVNPRGGKADAIVDLSGSPEYAVADGDGKVFVDIADRNEIAVVDTHTMKVVARWPVGPGRRPTGLAMDRMTRRLFVGCRNRELVIMNADNGNVLADFPIGAGVDATAFNDGFVFASCADGTLAFVREVTPQKFEAAQTLRTEPGARTMAVDGRSGTVYLPTSDLMPASPATAENPHPHPIPVAGTFRILVVTRSVGPEAPR
jgi:DNA-binding beta-propeller fold protein YncE